MLRHLGLLAEGKWFMLDGYDLLYIMDSIVQDTFKTSSPAGIEGNGAVTAPFRMSLPGHWRFMAQKAMGRREIYYRIGGRIIYKDAVNYTSDRGLVRDFDDGGAPVLGGAFGKAEGPSYKEYMNYVFVLNEEVHPHQRLADMCFGILRDDPPPLPPRIPTDRARAWQVLPVLTATMFISESIRNNRAFATNLMLLELISMGATYGLQNKEYSLAKAIWNPKDHADGHDDHTPLQSPKIDVYGNPVATRISELHLVGGKGAMTQKNAVDQAKPVLENIQKKPDRPILTYAQQKEVSLLLHWLQAKSGPWVPRNALVELFQLMPKDPVLPFDAVTSQSQNKISDKLKPMEQLGLATSMQRRRLAEIVMQIRTLISDRISRF